MMSPITVRYSVFSPKVPIALDGVRFAVLADLHNCISGEKKVNLVSALRREKPDCIFVVGDMVIEDSRSEKRRICFREAEAFLAELASEWPIYYENGNHEQRWKRGGHEASYEDYRCRLERRGIHFLENSSAKLCLRGSRLRVTGLELPYEYFRRGFPAKLTAQRIRELAGPASRREFQILLAHTPQFFPAYCEWGADLTLSGHFHGGMVRLPLLGGLVSTYLRPFPRYDRGQFVRKGRQMIVSSGLGIHTMPIRLLNPEEVVIVTLRTGTKPKKAAEKRRWI